MKLLLVDDHEMVRLGLKSYLSMQDGVDQVLEASDGQEGVELALQERPDVIIMDIVMPHMTGIEATLAILKEWSDAKILILTSYLDNEKIYPVLDAGAKGWEPKVICSKLPVQRKFFVQSTRWSRESWRLRQKSAKK